jgi:hypothetical protein
MQKEIRRFRESPNPPGPSYFLGTPHTGSSFSRWGTAAAKFLQPLGSNPLIVSEVTYDSLRLLELHREFTVASGDDVRVVNFFEQRKANIFKAWIFQWSEVVSRRPTGGKYQLTVTRSASENNLPRTGAPPGWYRTLAFPWTITA